MTTSLRDLKGMLRAAKRKERRARNRMRTGRCLNIKQLSELHRQARELVIKRMDAYCDKRFGPSMYKFPETMSIRLRQHSAMTFNMLRLFGGQNVRVQVERG